MSGSRNDHGPLVVGGEPRIDFLPTETKKRKEYRRQRRSLVALVIMVAVVCGLGVVFFASLAATSQATLIAEQARTQDLLKQQQEYAEAQSAAADLQTAEDARLVASATDVVWADYIDEIVKSLPEGALIRGLTIDGQSVLDVPVEASVLLQAPHVATVFLLIDTPNVATADLVLQKFKGLPYYADETAVTVEYKEPSYRTSIMLFVTPEALERRYFKNPLPDESTTNGG
jgi:hypothetical protein